jgi:hypothetical protein
MFAAPESLGADIRFHLAQLPAATLARAAWLRIRLPQR